MEDPKPDESAAADQGYDRQRGLYSKWYVRRERDLHGKHSKCMTFVLDMNHDPFARVAAGAYADACESEYPYLAADLRLGANIRGGTFGEGRKHLVDRVAERIAQATAGPQVLDLIVLEGPTRLARELVDLILGKP